MPDIEPNSSARPRLLVSVRGPDEALTALRAGADLIDAKDPERGALGALPPETVRAIVATVGGRAVTSAVAGDGTGTAIAAAIATMAATGVDFIKIAVGAADDAALAEAAARALGRVIGVLFAEDGVTEDGAARLAAAGFAGAMIDTRGKSGIALPALMSAPQLAAFVARCRVHGLMSGLAGSLGLADIPALSGLGADYLGFRGGLCRAGDRREALDGARVAQAVAAMRTGLRADAA
ncbi:tetrahydromethanopterin synthesis protein [Methylorubrum populi]|uniref:(5-formylfuran-3-yl)methyl phosphate synthase n=1 Tax=Methylorubrum populi TaxID=223967 RepID=A0A160PDM4_9HYPH|nr:(5-formylfuran-3-yl)methyl phosphate synthase [Methylorubrum populi]BAU90505.1 tetrahydromethanopterin synthesis protein [Methylorubrum populi]